MGIPISGLCRGCATQQCMIFAFLTKEKGNQNHSVAPNEEYIQLQFQKGKFFPRSRFFSIKNICETNAQMKQEIKNSGTVHSLFVFCTEPGPIFNHAVEQVLGTAHRVMVSGTPPLEVHLPHTEPIKLHSLKGL